jgi:hypothetical protein
LIPGTPPRFDAGMSVSSSSKSDSASRVSRNPCTPPVSGSPARFCAADARLRTVPPIAAKSPPSPDGSQSHEETVFVTCLRSALTCLDDGLSSGRNSSDTRTAPSGHEPLSVNRRSDSCMSCSDPPPMSSPHPSATVVVFAIAIQP